ncbi:hypothetical protein AN958_05173 [Leucoagaricus sp. SymC.cos]|nr:hypothetical protein AN958_05173 [Leucoagaricus sp. SymC.cos]
MTRNGLIRTRRSQRISPPLQPFDSNLEVVSVRTSDSQRTALPRDPPLDSVDLTRFDSSQGLKDALDLVKRVVSSTASSPPLLSDFNDLKLALRRFGPQLLRTLDAGVDAELLCLFGSISDEISACKFDTTLGGWTRGFERVNCWQEVVKMAEMREGIGRLFAEKESYWSMRAYLECSRQTGSLDALRMAEVYYFQLADSTRSESSVVIPYFGASLVSPSLPGFRDALNVLCDLLVRQNNPRRGVVDLFWRTILLNFNDLSPEHKLAIVNTMHCRVYSSIPTPSNQVDLPLCIKDLVVGLAASFFPCYQMSQPSSNVHSWAINCARESIAEEISLDDRFNNLILLAMWLLPQELSSSPDFHPTSDSVGWRAIIGLAVLDQSLRSQTAASSEQREMKDIAYSLWRLWRNVSTGTPKEVNRVVMTAFLDIAAQLKDEMLVHACIKDISSGALSVSHGEESVTRQVGRLFSALANCVSVFKGKTWTALISLLTDASHSPSHLDLYFRDIFRQLGTRDPQLAYRFYSDCLSRGLTVPPEASLIVVQHLALGQSWNQVTMFLQENRTLLKQLLVTILSMFRTSRHESTNPPFAKAVGEALLARFSGTYVPDQLKYPLQFFLPVMIASHHPYEAVQLLEVLLRTNPIMFSPRFFLRVIRTLLRYRQPALAIRVLGLAVKTYEGKSSVINDLVRKTKQALVRAGAVNLIHRLSPMATRDGSHPQRLRDRLLSLSARPLSWSMGQSLVRMIPALTTSPVNGSEVLIAVQSLVRNKRFAAAKYLIKRTHSQLKPTDLTAICNVYLHGPLLYWNTRNGRLMRHVLRSKNFLEENYAFIPDRVTVNIVIKAILRWRSYIDSRMVLALFDHLVRSGYPASKRWLIVNGVPFGTSPGEMALDLSSIRPGMSFKRHVQPLYKMFIRELFLRKNPRAAHRIIGILKEEEALAMEAKEHRERARRLGIVKKQRKRALARRASDP